MKRLLLALSVANLNLLSVWNELLYLAKDQLYFTPLATRTDFGWVLASWLGLAAVAYGLLRLLELGRQENPWPRLFVWGLLFVNPLNFVRVQLGLTLDAVESATAMILTVAACGVAILAARMPRVFATGIELFVLILSPLCLSNAAQAIWHASPMSGHPSIEEALSSPASPPPSSGGVERLVWIVFDELDGRMLFGKRDGRAETPAFEALRDEANFYSGVHPAGGHTIEAMPSFWLGERVVGFYLPYCRLFGGWVQSCVSGSFAVTRGWQSRGDGDVLRAHWRSLTPLWRREVYLETHLYLTEHALKAATDPQLDFITIHLAVPHDPVIFDAARGELTSFQPGLTYRDNIALADRTLAQITQAMQAAGVWQNTAVVVTSDHGWRGRDGYSRDSVGAVPLFVKLPGQRKGEVDSRDLDALILSPLLRALWTGELGDRRALAAWIDRNAGR